MQICCPVPLPQYQEGLLVLLSELVFPSVSAALSVPGLLLELLLELMPALRLALWSAPLSVPASPLRLVPEPVFQLGLTSGFLLVSMKRGSVIS